MSKKLSAAIAAGAFSVTLLAVPAAAQAAQCSNSPNSNGTWGQEICQEKLKDDPYGENYDTRGEYVNDNAKDSDSYGKGYSGEIHQHADPGKANPKPHRG